MEALTMHWYPDYITDPIHKMRSMRIIVKENATFDGMSDKLQRELDKKANEVGEILTNSANVWKSGRKVADIDTTNIDKNTKRIIEADPIYACALPLPNELKDMQSHQWNMEAGTLSVLGGALVDNISAKGISAGKVLAEASSAFGFRRPMIDPGMFQNYSGSSPRNFNFSFDFIPNNSVEAQSIMNIILNLKKFSLPRSIIGGVSLLSPFIFEIEIGNEKMRKLINMNDVVMTEIGVNYGADGNMQFFSNGMPKFIQLDLAFAERTLVTSEFYAPEE